MTPPAAAAAPAVRPRRPTAPRGPRRVSGPSRPAVAPRPTRARASSESSGLILGLISAVESLAQHRLLDRLIRGRTWIGIVAFALIGIVTLQLGLLKLNGGIGHALEREALLQRQNAALSIENSELSAGTRVQTRATQLGMAFAPTSALRFLSVHAHEDVAKAAAALSSAAHKNAEAHAAGAGETPASGETSEAESSGGETSATQESSEAAAGGEASSGASESSAAAESDASSETSSPASEAPAGESAASEAGAHEAGAHEAEPTSAASEAEPSGGIAASGG